MIPEFVCWYVLNPLFPHVSASLVKAHVSLQDIMKFICSHVNVISMCDSLISSGFSHAN